MAARFNLLFVFLVLALAGCAVNPVTGQQELVLVSESREIELGRKNYGPSRQMQGGDYTVDPALTTYVDGVGQELARVSDRPLPYEFVVLNNSIPNAWALPGGKIAVNRGLLLELENEAELAAVLAHEIVHAAARHGAKGVERGLFLQGALLAVGMASRGGSYGDYVVGGAQVAASMIHGRYSREAELEADYYGMLYMSRAGYDPRAAVELQKTFVSLSEGREPDWLAGLFASHPPSRERVAANIRTAGQLPAGGRLGQAQYQAQLAHLKKVDKGYQAYDEGRKALAADKFDEALSFSKKALAVEAREPLFHALRGDARLGQKKYREALINYNRALKLDDNYFYYYLRRGLARVELEEAGPAAEDLQKSVRLLPTAMAYNALGNIYLAQGRPAEAKKYFQAASQSKTEPGRQALRSFILLDLPANPDHYLKSRAVVSGDGSVRVEIANSTPLAARSISLAVAVMDQTGRWREFRRDLAGTIGAGESVAVDLGNLPIAGKAGSQAVRVRIIGAQAVR